MREQESSETVIDEGLEALMDDFEPDEKLKDKKRYILWSSLLLLLMILTALTTVLLERKSGLNWMDHIFDHERKIDTTVPRQQLTNISYDDHAIVINGKRQLLIVGAIHYPRSSQGMWTHLIQEAKEAGINTIDTYVFWNLHEPTEGHYEFEDLLRFLQAVKNENLWVNLRIGPYVCAEWNYGGFPAWIRDIVGLTARTWNQPFMDKMESFVRKTVQVIDPFLASKGGNIIMMQIENEYDNVIKSYGDDGKRYISWAADLANSLDTGVPWIMCLSEGIKTVITTCNGFYCDNWIGPHSSSKQPAMFTELWSGWFQHWDDPRPTRPAEDLAFSVARFIVRGGTYVSYYMWHGGITRKCKHIGTNFGRTGGDYQTTSYDYDAPVNEYGFPSQPKYDHLMSLHLLLREYEDLLLNVQPRFISAGWGKEIHIFGDEDRDERVLIVFSNYRDKNSGTFKFGDQVYIVPKWAVEFYKKKSDGELELLYSTARVHDVSMISTRDPKLTDLRLQLDSSDIPIYWIDEIVGPWDLSRAKVDYPQEQLSITKDRTDYLWYSLSNISLELSSSKQIQVNLKSVTDVWYIWIDDVLLFPPAISIPTSLNKPQEISAFLSSNEIALINESHNITILSVVMGLKNYGPWYDSVKKGLFDSMIYVNGNELSERSWVHQAGIRGEDQQYYNPDTTPGWKNQGARTHSSFVWYKIIIPYQKIEKLLGQANSDQNHRSFISFALNMADMGKGSIWVNGHSVGRYWDITPQGRCTSCDYAGGFSDHKCLTKCREPSQSYYHVPFDWVVKYHGEQIKDVNIVIFEEKGGNPNQIELVMLV